MGTPVWAAICGNIRNEVEVDLLLDYLLRCREEGKIQGIIFSTWENELDNFSELRRQLKDNGIQVIFNKPIDHVVNDVKSESVNYWRQTVQLQAALNVIPSEAIVIKTRTDRAMPATRKLIEMLADEDPLPAVRDVRERLSLMAFPQEFAHQIAIFHARTGRAFQFTDFAFMGYSTDLRKLLNFDISEFYYARGLVANMQFFIYPFVRDYPIVKDYFRRINFRFLIPDNAKYVRNGGTEFPKFLERFNAVYFGILASHFRIGTMNTKRVGKATLPIEFTDFFHTTHERQTAYNALGTIINSSTILEKFLTQSMVTVQPETQRVLDIIRTAKPSTFERATNDELQEMRKFVDDNKAFSSRHWFRIFPLSSPTQKRAYQSTIHYQFPGLTEEQQRELWEACQNADWIGNVLMDFWLKHEIKPADSPVYLLSSARDGDPFSLMMLTRMLRQGKLTSEVDIREVLKLVQFNGQMIARHDTGNIQAVCYILNYYLYMKEHGLPITPIVDLQVTYVFNRYLAPKKAKQFREVMDQNDSEKMRQLFSAEIIRLNKAGNHVIQRRITEMALEITHEPMYWNQLKQLIKEKEWRVRRFYDYANANGLLIEDSKD